MKDRRIGRPQAEVFSSRLWAAGRLVVYLLLTLFLVPVQAVAVSLGLRFARRFPGFYHRLCCGILGFDVRLNGNVSSARPTLFVSNHISYIDIIVFGSVLDTSFVAKAEVERWPLFGQLARLQRTVFVDRRGPKVVKQRDEIARRLDDGDNLVLFAEGTSYDGQRVLPFKSALFSVAEGDRQGKALTIQPVSVAYTQLDGIPMCRAFRPQFAWYGDMTLMSHLFEMLGIGIVTIELTFHDPIASDRFPTRKALADYCCQVVASGVDAANSGRSQALKTSDATAPQS